MNPYILRKSLCPTKIIISNENPSKIIISDENPYILRESLYLTKILISYENLYILRKSLYPSKILIFFENPYIVQLLTGVIYRNITRIGHYKWCIRSINMRKICISLGVVLVTRCMKFALKQL